MLFRRAAFVLVLLCLGCAAQTNDTALNQKIERRLRANYSVPDSVAIAISDRHPSDIQNYDAITVTLSEGAQKKVLNNFLVSKDGNTLIRVTKMDLTTDPYAEIMKKIDIGNRPVRGNKDAKVTVVTFDDFQCPYCAMMHEILFGQVFKDYSDRVRVIYKDFPLSSLHPWATRAALDANCLAVQNGDAYWDFADTVHGRYEELSAKNKTLMAHMDDLQKITLEEGAKHSLDMTKLNACLKEPNEAAVKESVAEGEGLGLDSTPVLYINGRKMDGVQTADQLRAALNAALKDAGEQPPVRQAAAPAPPPSGTK